MYPVVPAFGDLPISLNTIYLKAPHIDAKKFCDVDNEMCAKTYNICNYIEATRNEYNNFICEYGLIMEKVNYFLNRNN